MEPPPLLNDVPLIAEKEDGEIVLLDDAKPKSIRERPTEGESIGEKGEQIKDITADDSMPDGGYGWIVVICSFMLNASTFLSYYATHPELYSGATSLQYAFIGGLSIGLCFLSGPISNYLTTRMNFKYPMYMGAVLLVLSQCMAGLTSQIWQLFITQGVMFGLGMGLTYLPALTLIGQWFGRKRALANGISGAGSGMGGLVFVFITRSTLENLGLKWAFIINGIIVAVVIFPSIFFLKSRTKILNARFEPLQISWLWHPGFCWTWMMSCLCSLAYVTGMFTVVSYGTIGLGIPAPKAAIVQALLSLGQIIGRPLTGLAQDRYGRINVAILLTIIAGVINLVLWLPATNFATLAAFAFFLGLAGGHMWFSLPGVIADLVGIVHLASALVIFYLVNIMPNLCAEPIALALVNYSRNSLGRTGREAYQITIGLSGGLYLTAAVVLLGSRRYKLKSWKIWAKV